MKHLIIYVYLIVSLVHSASAQMPKFDWAFRTGAKSYDRGLDMATDQLNNVYTVGEASYVVDFNPGIGVFNLGSPSIQFYAYIAKYDSLGNFIWAKWLGGSSTNSRSLGIAIDTFSNVVYVTGVFYNHHLGYSDLDPGAGMCKVKTNGFNDVFVIKLDTTGNFIWGKTFGGVGDDRPVDICIISPSDIAISGYFQDKVDFDPGIGIHTIESTGYSLLAMPYYRKYDGFVVKLDSNGNFKWANGFGSESHDWTSSIAADSKGNVFVAGHFDSIAVFAPSVTKTSNGTIDAFLIKYDSLGNLAWVNTFGGRLQDWIQSITTDSNDNIFSTGAFSSMGTDVDFDPNVGIYNLNCPNRESQFIQKYDAAGNLIWAKAICRGGASGIGYSNYASSAKIILDKFENILTAGSFRDEVDFNPDPIDTFILRTNSDGNSFVSKYTNNGDFLWARSIWNTIPSPYSTTKSNTIGHNYISSIAVDTSNNIYGTGWFHSPTDFNPNKGTYVLNSDSDHSDIFVFKWRYYRPNEDDDDDTTITGGGSTGGTINSKTTGLIKTGVGKMTLGISSKEGEGGILFYPNPASDYVTFESDLLDNDLTISIFNSIGQSVYQQKSQASKTNIDIQHLVPGIYLLKITTTNQLFKDKFIIVR